jgi:asparagine synthase (glutamine-hydrolysing)
MCGIVGCITEKQEILNNQLNLIKHRGPDFSNQLFYEDNNKFISLGHVRLSIIDLESRSNQPFKYLDRYTIIYNGELYNYIELKNILLKIGYKFKTKSDTEVLVAAFDYYKYQVFDYLDGMFTFCIYDQKEHNVILSRDHLGIKPLYYYFDKQYNNLYFASELKALFAFNRVPKKISKNDITEFLFNGWLYEPNTGFENILKVMPGEYIIYSLQNQSIEKKIYFDVASSKIKIKQSIETLIDNSIDMQKRTDVKLGSFFSGGVDSSLIVAKVGKTSCLTAKYNKEDINTSGIEDDYKYSLAISKILNLDLITIELKSNEINLNDLNNFINNIEELNADFTYLISYKISKVANELGYKVMLSGMGADEIFGGYPRYKVVKYKTIFKLLKPALIFFKPLIKKNNFFNKKINRLISFIEEKNLGLSYSYLIGSFDKNEILNLTKNEKSIEYYINKINGYINKVQDKSFFKKAFYLDLYGFLSHNFIVADKSSMQASIEMRVPLVNKFLLLKNFYEDENKLIDFFNTKKQLKKILVKYLPKNIVNRKKSGFNPPLDNFINNIGREELKNIISKTNINLFLDINIIYNIIDEHFDNKNNNTYKLWQLLFLSYWIDNATNID